MTFESVINVSLFEAASSYINPISMIIIWLCDLTLRFVYLRRPGEAVGGS